MVTDQKGALKPVSLFMKVNVLIDLTEAPDSR